MITGYEIKIEGEKRYPENEVDTISETTAQRLAFSRGAKWMQQQSMRWVSINDRLPDDGAVVLVSTRTTWTTIATYRGGSFVIGPYDQKYLVTHWMPLPSPPTTE